MSRRSKLSLRGSRGLFRATSDKVHVYNMNARPMRGGNRL